MPHAGFAPVLDAQGKTDEAVHVRALVVHEPGLDPRGHDPALKPPEQGLLVVQPGNERRVRIVLGADPGQGEAGQIGKFGRLRESCAELLDDAVQLIGFRLLELDADLVQNEAGREVQLRFLVGELAGYEGFAFGAQPEQPEELLFARGPLHRPRRPGDPGAERHSSRSTNCRRLVRCCRRRLEERSASLARE